MSERQAEAWLFKEEAPSQVSPADLEIRFSSNFQALWRYDWENNDYLRLFNGKEANDSEERIKAKNIIVQKVDSKVLDKIGRLDLEMQGEGEAIVCLDGNCQLATWRKQGQARTRYYYENGEEIKLNPGISWIEIADSFTQVNY